MIFIKKLKNFFSELFLPFTSLISKPDGLTGINCVMRLGLPGSGKTLDQTIYDVLPHLIAGEQVYSSYWINWNRPNLTLFQEFEEVENLRNCVVVFDEIGQILPARQWELEGLRVQLFFQLHRHRHVDIIGNTQDVSLVSKTVGIVANKWYFIVNKNIPILNFFASIFNLGHVRFTRTQLTYSALKKMANGWELDGVFPTTNKRDKLKTKWITHKKLLFENLDEYKIELVHKHCSRCKFRQGSQILKHNTLRECSLNKKTGIYTLKIPEYCPKHKDELLTIRKTGIYDTDHEPSFPEKTITFQPLIDSPPAYKKIPYKGKLTETQLLSLKEIKNTYSNR